MEDLKDADFVVEVVFEEMELKKKVFKELDELTRKDVIIATNTSSMSITEIATATQRQDKVVGMHFFNPVPLMRLVEVIRGYNTSDETIAVAMDLARKFKKEPIEVKKDIPCFRGEQTDDASLHRGHLGSSRKASPLRKTLTRQQSSASTTLWVPLS